MSRGTKEGWIAAKKYVKRLFKVIDRFTSYLILIYAWTWDKTCWWGRVEFFLQFNAKKKLYAKSSSRFEFKCWILNTASLNS